MAPRSTAVRSDSQSQQVKYKGILEPKGRVKGFRVEIRPPGSSRKIWVGTFDSRSKAMRAYDVTVYLTGKEPYYFVYPKNYFPSRTPVPSKGEIQKIAKSFSEKTDHLEARVNSRLRARSKAGQAKNLGSEQSIGKKVAENMLPEPLKTLEGLHKFLQEPQDVDVPLQLGSERVPVEDSQGDLEKSAYHRGFTSKQNIWTALPDTTPLFAPDAIPAVEDEGRYLNFDTPLEVSSEKIGGVSEENEFWSDFVEWNILDFPAVSSDCFLVFPPVESAEFPSVEPAEFPPVEPDRVPEFPAGEDSVLSILCSDFCD